LLDRTTPALLGFPTMLVGGSLCCVGLGLGGRRVTTTRYRPDPWQTPEWLVAGSGVLAAAMLIGASVTGLGSLTPSFSPLRWPTLPLLPTVAILLGALPAFAAPPPPAEQRAPAAPPRPRVSPRAPGVAA
jgi:energy-coupling factor transport system permease protein